MQEIFRTTLYMPLIHEIPFDQVKSTLPSNAAGWQMSLVEPSSICSAANPGRQPPHSSAVRAQPSRAGSRLYRGGVKYCSQVL